MHTQYVIWPYQRTKSLRSGFCILFPPVVIWLSVKFKFTGVGTSGLFIHSSHSSPGLPPSPLLPCSALTAWHYYDTEAVALLWQQAGWPEYVLVKKTACQRQRERERKRETQDTPLNSWAQSPPFQPPAAPSSLSNTTQTLGTLRISHSSFITHSLHTPLNLLPLFLPNQILTLLPINSSIQYLKYSFKILPTPREMPAHDTGVLWDQVRNFRF